MMDTIQDRSAAGNDRPLPNSFLTFTGILASLSLPLVLVFLRGGSVTPETALKTYVEAILSLAALFLAMYFLAEWLHQKSPQGADSFFAAYATLANPVVCILILLLVTRALAISSYLALILLLHLTLVILWWYGRKRLLATAAFEKINSWMVALFPVFLSVVFWAWFYSVYKPSPGLKSLIGLAVVLIGTIFYTRLTALQKIRHDFRTYWWAYILLALLLIGLVYRPDLFFDRHHFNFFLAPLNDILHGRVLFVNSTSQYGVGVIYFLAGIYRILGLPIYYGGLSLIGDVLFIIQYALLFLMLLKVTRSPILSLAGMAAIIYFNFLSVYWPSMLRTPAQSPLRYGFTYILLLVAMIGADKPGKTWGGLELALLGICSIWSLETFLYTILSLDAYHFIADVLSRPQVKTGMVVFLKRIALQLAVVGLAWGALLAFSFVFSGHWPNLVFYWDYFTSYTAADQYSHPIDIHSFWPGLTTAIYLLSIFFVLYARLKRKDIVSVEMASLLAGMSVAGLLQFTYYFVYDIDYHLALLCVPLIFVLFCWLAVVLHAPATRWISMGLRLSFGLTMGVSLWVCAVHTLIHFHEIGKKTLVYEIASGIKTGQRVDFASPYHVGPSSPQVAELVGLIDKYAPAGRQMAIFVQPDDETEALLLTEKVHLLDISEADMSAISPAYADMVLRLARESAGLPVYIFYDSGKGELNDLQQQAFNILTSAAAYTAVDQAGPYIVLEKK